MVDPTYTHFRGHRAVGDEAGGVGAENELAREDEALSRRVFNVSDRRGTRTGVWGTYALRGVVWDEVPCALDENIRPVALLMDDPGLLPVAVEPRCGWSARESLYPAESCVLR